MFKRCLAIVILFALIASSFQRYFIYAGFELNHNYIAKNLCINRSRPWMHCNGRCYFMRKLKEAQENEKKQAERDNLNRVEVSFFQQPIAFDFLSFNVEQERIAPCDIYSCLYTNQYVASLFRPPRQPFDYFL